MVSASRRVKAKAPPRSGPFSIALNAPVQNPATLRRLKLRVRGAVVLHRARMRRIMNILGIHIGHDSSAALVVDGRIVADVAEERFTRLKHYAGLPIRAIEYCLKSQRLTMADL